MDYHVPSGLFAARCFGVCKVLSLSSEKCVKQAYVLQWWRVGRFLHRPNKTLISGDICPSPVGHLAISVPSLHAS